MSAQPPRQPPSQEELDEMERWCDDFLDALRGFASYAQRMNELSRTLEDGTLTAPEPPSEPGT